MAKKNNRRTRKQRGGGWAFTGATIPGVNNYGQVNTPIGDCRAAPPPGYIAAPYPQKGLPGMSGGRRSRRNRRQYGGRYGFDLANPVPGAAAPWAGGIPPVQRIACEGSTPNPLNPGPHTPSTAPPAPSGNSFLTSLMSGGRRSRRNRRQGGGGLGTDNLAYYAPTAGYANGPSRWVDSVGAPVLLQKPYDAQAWNPACVKTGGGRKNRSRSNRKNTRRNNRK
jgi:hypothetical protein